MLLMQELRRQAGRAGGTLIVTYGLLLLLMVVSVALALKTHTPLGHLTRDPAAIAHLRPLDGVLSNLGIIFWCFAASVCLFCSRLLAGRASWFLLCSGAVTTVLMLDDFFQLHEHVFRHSFHVPQILVYGAYAAMLLLYLLWFSEDILRTDFAILVLALGLFAFSTFVDVASDHTSLLEHIPGRALLEDGAKLAGIVTWFLYFARTASAYVTAAPSRPAP